jgi:hypothetical protein
VSTRCGSGSAAARRLAQAAESGEPRLAGGDRPLGARKPLDPAHEVGLVARARRDVLLRAYRHQLRWEDLEDCFSQATLELLVHVRGGGTFADRRHLSHTLTLRFVSRIRDARRAAAGRSPITAALAAAVSLGGAGQESLAVRDCRLPVEQAVMLRHDLRRVGRLARELTADQRLALACELAGHMPCAEFCRRNGWTEEKYRKVLQRARARLRLLASSEEEPCPDAATGSETTAGCP